MRRAQHSRNCHFNAILRLQASDRVRKGRVRPLHVIALAVAGIFVGYRCPFALPDLIQDRGNETGHVAGLALNRDKS